MLREDSPSQHRRGLFELAEHALWFESGGGEAAWRSTGETTWPRNDGCDTRRGRVLQRGDEKKKPAQLIVAALSMITIKRLNNENVLAADANQWPRLMLAILELAFLVRAGLNGPAERLPVHQGCDCC